jgi:glucose-1-phosphate cytidylyltransferase
VKTVLLAGGYGTRLSEETRSVPKPMVEIGGRPILWHIMELYAQAGFSDFLVACGYKQSVIKEFFHHIYLHRSDVVLDLAANSTDIVDARLPDWRVGLFDTGLDTLTGGRILRLREHLADGTFMVTYGDGLSDVDIAALVAFHRTHGRLATLTAVRPPARFGALELDDEIVRGFSEKSQASEGWINGGFMVLEPGVLEYLDGDDCSLEREPVERLAAEGELMAYRHEGFWQPMDTLRDQRLLQSMWDTGAPPWRPIQEGPDLG